MQGKSDSFYYFIDTPKEVGPINTPEPVNQRILEQAKQMKKSFTAEVKENTDVLRDMFVKDIAPKLLPVVSALEDAKDILTEIVGQKVEAQAFTLAQKMVFAAAEVKLATRVATYLGLSKLETDRFFQKIEQDKAHEKILSGLRNLRNVPKTEEGAGLLVREILAGINKAAKKRKSTVR